MGAPHWPRTPRGVEPVRETCIYAHQNIFGQPLAHGVEQHLFHKNGGLWEAIFSLIILTKNSNNFSPHCNALSFTNRNSFLTLVVRSLMDVTLTDEDAFSKLMMFLLNPISPSPGGAELPPPRANAYTRKKSMGGNSDNFIPNVYS